MGDIHPMFILISDRPQTAYLGPWSKPFVQSWWQSLQSYVLVLIFIESIWSRILVEIGEWGGEPKFVCICTVDFLRSNFTYWSAMSLCKNNISRLFCITINVLFTSFLPLNFVGQTHMVAYR
jgi:hypothetical protein